MAHSREYHVSFLVDLLVPGACGHGILAHHESLRETDRHVALHEMQRHTQTREGHMVSRRREGVYPVSETAHYSRIPAPVRMGEVVQEPLEAWCRWIVWSENCSNTDDLDLIRETVPGKTGILKNKPVGALCSVHPGGSGGGGT